jgi:pimeloyl-ACP methyl ester carboxylesterase
VSAAERTATTTVRDRSVRYRDEGTGTPVVLLPAVAATGIPALGTWGDRDPVLPHSHLAAARTALRGARTQLFPDTGHMPQVERAEELAELVTDFWAGAGRG